MDDQMELELWLALIHAQCASPGIVGRQLHSRWPGSSLADLAPAQASQLLGRVLDALPETRKFDPSRLVERDLEWLHAGPDRHLLPVTDPRYPALLREIPDPPLALFVRGDLRNLAPPCLSMVGARNPTPQGRETARSFARALAQKGLVVVSGLARGIDGAAHLGALESGTTVAVCGNGLDIVYPRAHRALADRIADGGALVSEFPAATPPRKQHFPMRNRVISGMSLGTLVVEAGLRSGSLITARLAAEQNREVFAVPGSINSPQAKGCHELIKKGVTLVESIDDILLETGCPPAAAGMGAPLPGGEEAASEHAWFLDHMGYEPCTRDELVKRSGLTSARVSSMLLTLELEGCVELCPGGTYVRVN